MFDIKVVGLDKLPSENKIILAVNHTSYLDSVAFSSVIPKKIKWVVRKDIYRIWWLKWVLFLAGTIPENGAVGASLISLEKGNTVGVFPEGTRSRDGKLKAGKKGVAILALKTGTVVVPCAIRGSFEAFPRTARFPKPHPVTVVIGDACRFEKNSNPDETTIDSALNKIMSDINSLMDNKA